MLKISQELLYFHVQELNVDNLFETRKQSAFVETEDSEPEPEPELEPEPQGRAITFFEVD